MECVVDSFIDVCPILFVTVVSVVSSALSLLYVSVLLFFSGPCSGACSVSYFIIQASA